MLHRRFAREVALHGELIGALHELSRHHLGLRMRRRTETFAQLRELCQLIHAEQRAQSAVVAQPNLNRARRRT